MRVWVSILLPVGLIGVCAPAFAADALSESGSAKLAAYQVCHPLGSIDMGAEGSRSATECNGIVKNLDNQKLPDNLLIHCIEDTNARPESYKYSGACVQTDGDGDKIFMSYDGSQTGEIKWLGGTGKYKDLSGAGSLGVVVAPGGTPGLFAYTLNYNVSWTHKTK